MPEVGDLAGHRFYSLREIYHGGRSHPVGETDLRCRQIAYGLPAAGPNLMNEYEWLHSTDPVAMLVHLETMVVTDFYRRLRLFVCAICSGSREASVRDAIKGIQDGSWAFDDATAKPRFYPLVKKDNLFLAARSAARRVIDNLRDGFPSGLPAQTVTDMLRDVFGNPYRPVTEYWPGRVHDCGVAGKDLECVRCGEKLYGRRIDVVCPYVRVSGGHALVMADVGRCCRLCGAFGDSASSIPCEPKPWLRRPYVTPEVISLANSIYADRDFAALPVLADAMEEAGCGSRKCWSCDGRGCHLGAGPDRGNPECRECDGTGRQGGQVIKHLRGSSGEQAKHVPGCWALDLARGML
jgi:hypothetical protein